MADPNPMAAPAPEPEDGAAADAEAACLYRSEDDSDGEHDEEHDHTVLAPHEQHNAGIHDLGEELVHTNREAEKVWLAGMHAPHDPERLSVHLATANIGNEVPPVHLHPWVPAGGMGSSIIVACGQEATYDDDRIRESTLGRLHGIIDSAKLVKTAETEKDCDPYCVMYLESDFPDKPGKPDKAKKMSHTETWAIIAKDGKAELEPVWHAHFDVDAEKPKSYLKKVKGPKADAIDIP